MNSLKNKNTLPRFKQATTLQLTDLITYKKAVKDVKCLTAIDSDKLGIQCYRYLLHYEDGEKEILTGYVEIIEEPYTFSPEPYVARPSRPVNEIKDVYDYNRQQSVPIYHTFIADGPLKIMITVRHNDIYDQDQDALREYQVVKYNGLFLDQSRTSMPAATDGQLSVNPEITQAMFQHILSKYGIILEQVIMHDYVHFEVPKFHFEDKQKQNALEDIVNKKFRR